MDSKDRALVWRVTGGKHRYLTGDCVGLVEDDAAGFRQGAIDLLAGWTEPAPSSATLRAEQDRLTGRRQRFAGMRDGLEVWAALGVPDPRQIPIMDRDSLVALRKGLPA